MVGPDKSWSATRAPKRKRTRTNARDENSKRASAKNANAAPKRNTMTIVPCMLLRGKKTMDHGKPTCCRKCSWKRILVAPGVFRTWQANLQLQLIPEEHFGDPGCPQTRFHLKFYHLFKQAAKSVVLPYSARDGTSHTKDVPHGKQHACCQLDASRAHSNGLGLHPGRRGEQLGFLGGCFGCCGRPY